MPSRSVVQTLPDGSIHGTGVWIMNQKSRRGRDGALRGRGRSDDGDRRLDTGPVLRGVGETPGDIDPGRSGTRGLLPGPVQGRHRGEAPAGFEGAGGNVQGQPVRRRLPAVLIAPLFPVGSAVDALGRGGVPPGQLASRRGAAEPKRKSCHPRGGVRRPLGRVEQAGCHRRGARPVTTAFFAFFRPGHLITAVTSPAAGRWLCEQGKSGGVRTQALSVAIGQRRASGRHARVLRVVPRHRRRVAE